MSPPAGDVRLLWTLEDWASAVIALPITGPLPERTVLVPNERVAHALRRALMQRGEHAALVGTRFVRLLELAREIVSAAGEQAVTNEREIGAVLVREALRTVRLERFVAEDLLAVPGWDAAFARTFADAEGAGLSSDDLLASPDAHVRDVGRVFEALHSQGRLLTASRLMQRATALVTEHAGRGATLAVVTGFESLAEIRLLHALPLVRWAIWSVRPLRVEHTERLLQLFGASFPVPGQTASSRVGPATALRQVHEGLFVDRPEKWGVRDETVQVATYAGVHEEVEAAVSWVVEQLVEHGTPASEIAILSPRPEPYSSLLRSRLAALPWETEQACTFSEQGVPVVERSDGARLLLALRALREGLSREALAPLLPILRTHDPEQAVRGLSRAWELLNVVAVVGGDRGHPQGGGMWAGAWESAILRLERAPAGGGGLEEREQTARKELQRDLLGLGAAIDALCEVLRQVGADDPLSKLATSLSLFARTHLKLPPAQPPAWSVLDDAAGSFAGHEDLEPRGVEALVWLDEALSAEVVSSERFGTPRIYLGSFSGARGLSFRAVRLIGLVEGAVTSAVREDPVLADQARTALSPFLLTSRQRAHRQLSAFDDAVRAAHERLALSAPRVSNEGSVRQPAAVLLDVMRALSGADDERGLERMLEDAAGEGRTRERQVRERLALSGGARLSRMARGDSALARTETSSAIALDSLRSIRDRAQPGAQDGLLRDVMTRERMSGLSAERPISASRLSILLACPHRYLYENLLGFREASEPLPTHLLHAMIFGTWLHGIAEEYWREHGAALGAREPGLMHHQDALRVLARERFVGLGQTYPFSSPAIAHAQCEALCDQLEKLLTLDWLEGVARPFVDVEREFGYDEPCALETSAGPLHVRGKIDKLDRDGEALLVRDIKTGAGKPRRAGEPPDVSIDLQLGVYAQVATRMAATWGTPTRVGVAYLYLRSGEPERSWTGSDYAQLDLATREWLATAVETLEQGSFARSPNRQDCRYCPHQPVCEPEVDRAQAVLADPRVPRRLALLKQREER